MVKKPVQQDRSKVRDVKNNERHVCGRARDGERPVSSGEAYTIFTRPPNDCGNRRFPGLYVEALSDVRTPLGEKRVSARWGEAGENNGFWDILKMAGWT